MKTHDRDFFCKYVTSNVAKKILRELEVRYSSPLLFNDPFDTQTGLKFGFELEEFQVPFVTEIEQLVFGEQEFDCDSTHPMCGVIKVLRVLRHKLKRDDFLAELGKAAEEGIRTSLEYMEQVNREWIDFLRHVRLFCVVEEPNNLLMWAHYADSHKGAVLKFKCIPELDTALCAARAISYQRDIPVIANLDEWIDHSTGQVRMDFSNTFYQLAFTKSDHWAYEKEWRCYTHRISTEGELLTMSGIYPEEIDSIFLGCRISETDRDEILSLLSGRLDHVKVLQGKTQKRQFDLEFDRIK